MPRGKHSADSKYSYDKYDEYDEELSLKKKIIIGISVLVLIVAVLMLFFLKNDEKEENVVENNVIETNTTLENTYEGYNVLGKIKIEEFGVEQYILDSTSDDALEKGVIRLYGGTLNNYGNFCIAGHNKEGVFAKLEEMEVGDNFTVIEKDLKETTYEVKEIYTVEADDLKCLLQNEEKIEITLITCNNASTTRLIVKAEEVL
mgnify:CR=1 FL=1